MKDKTTLIVVVACLAALLGWQHLVNFLYPPRPLPEETLPLATTNEAPAQMTAPAVEEAPRASLPTETAASSTPTPAPLPATPGTPRPPEEFVVLQNEKLRAAFTSWGGGIRTIELFDYKNNGQGNVVLNTTNAVPALVLTDLTGADSTAIYSLEKLDSQTVRLRALTSSGLEVIKTITLSDEYLFDGVVTINQPVAASLSLVVGTATPVGRRETPDMLGVGRLDGEDYENIALAGGFGCGGSQTTSGAVGTENLGTRWVAVNNQFFGLLLNPDGDINALGYDVVDLPQPADGKAKQPPQGIQATVELAPSSSSSGDGTQEYTFRYYAGPKEYQRLVQLADGEEELMHFGFWGVISVVLLRGMNFFYSLAPNYGVSIILITFIIKIVFWPIQAKSMKSMKAMQKFQPLMTKLREKYKDDPQRMNMEMMKLYKEHKINPLAGCLPMLVQIPVFFAFYTMLRSAIELRGASFLWIHDLSQPDTVGHLLGFPVNPLPLVMGISMIGQMKLTPSGGDPKQQQMMMFMPLMFLFICYNMSSGLVLYWTVQQLLSIAQQWWTLKHAEDPSAVTVIPPPRKK